MAGYLGMCGVCVTMCVCVVVVVVVVGGGGVRVSMLDCSSELGGVGEKQQQPDHSVRSLTNDAT
jgi:hypothetical protein